MLTRFLWSYYIVCTARNSDTFSDRDNSVFRNADHETFKLLKTLNRLNIAKNTWQPTFSKKKKTKKIAIIPFKNRFSTRYIQLQYDTFMSY